MVIPQSFYANVTLIDVQLASAYYPILVDLAKHKLRIPLKTATHSGSKPPAIAIQKRH